MDYSESQTSDADDIDPENYKGIFYNVDTDNKYQDPDTGAHFKFADMCAILSEIKQERDKREKPTQSRQLAKEQYKSQDQKASIKSIAIESKDKPSRNKKNDAIPLQGFSSGNANNHLSKVPVTDPFKSNSNTVDLVNRKSEQENAFGAKRLSTSNHRKPMESSIKHIITKILGPKPFNFVQPKNNVQIKKNSTEHTINKPNGRNVQSHVSTNKDVIQGVSRNNFFSFDNNDKDAKMQRKLSVKKYISELPKHSATSSLGKSTKYPTKTVLNGMKPNYLPGNGLRTKDLYNKIQSMKSNVNGKRTTASRQASKQINHTTTDHQLGSQI